MRRWLGWIAILWLLLVCVLALLAYGRPSATPSLEERTQTIAAQLRCPVCQGESVADSQAPVAQDIRHTIGVDLAHGQSPAQIRHGLDASYAGLSLAPPASGIGSLAWLAPPLLLLGGVALLLTMVADWRGRGRGPARVVRGDYLERVRAELAAREAAGE